MKVTIWFFKTRSNLKVNITRSKLLVQKKVLSLSQGIHMTIHSKAMANVKKFSGQIANRPKIISTMTDADRYPVAIGQVTLHVNYSIIIILTRFS